VIGFEPTTSENHLMFYIKLHSRIIEDTAVEYSPDVREDYRCL